MSNYDCTKDLAFDISLDNQSLREQIKKLQSDYNEEKRLRLIAEMDLRFANEKLRDAKASTIPVIVDDEINECECPHCNVTLKPDWWACPGCGKRIEWDAKHYDEPDENEAYDRWCDDHPGVSYSDWLRGDAL